MLKVWIPGTTDVRDNGLNNSSITNTGVTIDANGKIGNCLKFNNAGNLIGRPGPLSNNTNDWTFACWMKVNASHNGCLFSDRTEINNTGISIFYFNAQWIIDDGVRWQFNQHTVISSNTWYHVCVVRKKGIGKYLFINGVLDSSTTTTGTPSIVSTEAFAIGNSQSSSTTVTGNQFNGYLNDIRVYDNALSPREVKEISKGLVLHYPLSPITENSIFGDIVTDQSPYKIRAIPNTLSNMKSKFDQIVGGSVVWNQLISNGDFSDGATGWYGVGSNPSAYHQLTVTDGVLVITSKQSSNRRWGAQTAAKIIANHKYLVTGKTRNDYTGTDSDAKSHNIIFGGITSDTVKTVSVPTKDEWRSIDCVVSATYDNTVLAIQTHGNVNLTAADVSILSISNIQVIDLTAMFGTAIADYIYNLEQATAGAGVEWFRKLFPKDFYEYCAPTIKSVEGLMSHDMVGFNAFDGLMENGDISENTGQNSGASTSRTRCVNYIPVIPGQSYYFHVPGRTGNFRVYKYDEDKTYKWYNTIAVETIYTIPSGVHYIRFRFPSAAVSDDANICINLSDQAKNGTYEPYISHSYSFTNPPILRGVYKLDANNNIYADGDIWDSNGNVSRNYAVMVLDGTNQKFTGTFGLQDSGNYVVYKTMPVNRTPYTLCDRFVYSTQGVGVMPLYSYVSSSGIATTWSFALPNTITSLDEANAWLVNNPVTIVYKKATPTIETATKYTNPQIIEPNGTELYNFTGLIPPGHITKYIDIEVEGGNYTYDESLENLGMTDNIEYDVSGYGNNGIKNNITASSNTTRYLSSSSFNGTDSYIKKTDLDFSSNIWTASVWYYLPTAPSAYQCILCLSKGNGADANKKIAMCPNSTYIWFKAETSNTTVNVALKVGQWTHVAMSCDGSSYKIYVNGQLLQANTVSSTVTGCTDFLVGARANAEDATSIAVPFNGNISDVRLYATCLSESDILALYNTPISLANDGTLLTQGEYVEV